MRLCNLASKADRIVQENKSMALRHLENRYLNPKENIKEIHQFIRKKNIIISKYDLS